MAHIEHRHLRSALEFAVLIAAEGQKRRPPLAFPKELKAYFSSSRLPSSALGRVRRAIEADDGFRRAIAAGALAELVDDVGRLWLGNQPGWESQAADLVLAADEERATTDARRDLRRAEKRRVAAEQATARLQIELLQRIAELDDQRNELDALRAELAKAEDTVTEMRSELIDTRNEVRHARDREAAAIRRAEAKHGDAGPDSATQGDPATLGPSGAAGVGAAEPAASQPTIDQWPESVLDGRMAPVDAEALRNALSAARELAGRLEFMVAATPEVERPNQDSGRERLGGARRVPLALPGGVIATSGEAAEHLLRSDAAVFIDGYNVAKLAWPDRSLEQQRDALIARVENLVRRFGTEASIVFDGASVIGAHARGARQSVRVVFSPDGVTADDVIRDEADRVPAERAVVVVTDDREIVRDMRAVGANVVPSNAFLAVL